MDIKKRAMRKLLSVILFIPLFAQCTTYTWDNTNPNIFIIGQGTGKTFLNDLVAGDIVNIPARTGGYNSFSMYKIRGSAAYNSIQVNWQTGAYITRNFTTHLFDNLIDSCVGVTVRAWNMSGNIDLAVRWGKNPFGPYSAYESGYSSYIRIVSGTFNNMVGMGFDLWSSMPTFNGTEARTFHHIWIDSCRYDTSFNDAAGDQSIAIPMGRIRSDYWVKDLTISNSYFNRFWSITGPSVFIKLNNVWGASIYGNTFSNLGMATNPAGHAFSIGWDIGGAIDIYNNTFGPYNFGNDVRGRNGGAQVFGDNYNRPGRCYNNIVKDKRKYAFEDFRHPDPADSTTLAPYMSGRRYGNEAYFNTVYYLSIDGNPEPSALCLWYEIDTVVAKNNVMTVCGDCTSFSTQVSIVAVGIPGSISRIDTSANKVVQLWVNSGITDSTGLLSWYPIKSGLLFNAAGSPPAFITTDYYGNPRTSFGGTDIGAVELQATTPTQMVLRGRKIIKNL